jgi:choline dehydrogenase-like flavoprotein
MADDQHYDVVIIGTGAGGGSLGHRLATNGVKVLWLERGPFLPRERDNWQTDAVFVRGKYLAQELWYDRHGTEFQPEANYYVGGNTKFYGAALFRLRPEDFGGEDLPQADNRVTVDAEGAIHLTIDEKNNIEGVKRLRHKLDGMLSQLGMHEHHLLDRSLYLHKSMPIGATAHQAGTVRFGTDPAASALDVNCKAHDVDNLYIVDTSFFPSIGAVNPSLTAIANALRVGDHITERLR